GRHHTGLKIVHRFRVVASLKFVLTSGNQESLFGPEATLLSGGAHFCTELLTWERKIALDAAFSRVIGHPFLCGAFVAQSSKNRPHISHSLDRSCRSNLEPCGRIPLCSNTQQNQQQTPAHRSPLAHFCRFFRLLWSAAAFRYLSSPARPQMSRNLSI